ncbi:DUF2897 family protein [Pseudidiomarina homiensis]|uniref:DUF2897 domain-containing protein n=1 Tax=Pseudidiomarina homiensis TaxID=364198 RepID=A0A432Y3F6_9GAMM|nr:DUF2897 family protein [Pseudidiomarina homiensis]RUO55488.1 DUF2897 domain-containing protein [Pseudidiomarina homiensis]
MAFWLILLVVFAVVIGNIMLLKHTAHMKMPSLKQRHSEDKKHHDAWDDEDDS